MSNPISLKIAPTVNGAMAIAGKTTAVSLATMPDWRAIAGLPPSVDCNITSPKVTQQKAQAALDRLLVSLPQSGAKKGGDDRLHLDRLASTDMQLIIAMAGNLNLGVFSDLCQSISKQMERAAEVQTFLRDKRVADYQQQIDKAVEQADKAKKAGIFNAVCDWFIGAVEVIYGAIKVAEGVLTGNPVALASGAAYLAAGTAGLVKAAAETAMLLGASKEKCQEVIDVAGKVQLGCECFAMAVDLFQAGRAINAARVVTKGAGDVLKAGSSEVLLDAIKSGVGEEIEPLIEQFAKDVSKQVSTEVAMQGGEIEMVEARDMASAAAKQAIETEMTLARNITKSFTHAGVERLVKDATKTLVQEVMKKGITLTAEEFEQQCTKAIMKKMIKQIIKDIATSPLLILQKCTQGVSQINSGQLSIQKSGLQKEIEQLLLNQEFTQFMDEWVEKNKQQQTTQLKDISHDAQETVGQLNDNIHQNGMLQTKIANSLI
ncbi:type III secretion system translocon subunit SctE [Yersinia sp. Marseille-Q3913]|uniref:type III secretion system translocon subunit SctE n=1 Tax=Yersinia sp. Marseille-Q3913 TaxID=2830769 RepID=UPI001BAF6F32|nr:type III secretion system translocon subunit SctE [Yersinia sp. Marseille-Q3913]